MSAVVYLSVSGFCLERFPLPLGAWDGIRYSVVALPDPFIKLFHKTDIFGFLLECKFNTFVSQMATGSAMSPIPSDFSTFLEMLYTFNVSITITRAGFNYLLSNICKNISYRFIL